MKAKLVECVNCRTEGMKIPAENNICPICGAVNTLITTKEIECSEDEVLSILKHTYEPTDTEGYTYECTECGHYNSLWYGMEFNGSPLNKDELKDFSINRKMQNMFSSQIVEGDDSDLNFFQDKNEIIYAEICSVGVIENIKKLYGDDSIKSYQVTTLNNGLLAIEAIVPNHPIGTVVVFQDDCSDSFIDMMKNYYVNK